MMTKKNIIISVLMLFLGLVLLAVTYILFLNFKSLKIQRIVKQETMRRKLTSTSASVISSYPWIPNLTVVAEPVAVQKARYLINEKKYKQARTILKKDASNPFDGRKEFFIARTFYNEKKYDSAIYYSKKCYDIKPRFYGNLTIMASSYEKKGNIKASLKIWENFLEHSKEKPDPWRVVSAFNNKLGNIKKAEMYIDSALVYHPKNKKLLSLQKTIKYNALVSGENKVIYDKASKEFKAKNYKKALTLYTNFIARVPNYPQAYQSRSYCNYYQKKYQKSIEDIDKLQNLSGGKLIAKVINLKGVNYFQLGNRTEACKYFKQAKAMGDKDGISNTKKFCK